MTRSPSLLALTTRSLSAAEWMLCAFPFLGGLVQVVVGCTDRYAPVASVVLLVVLLPVLLILSMPSVSIRDRDVRWVLIIGLAFCCWNAAVTFGRHNLESYWWRIPERSAALCAFLALCGGKASAGERLRVMAMACSSVVILGMSLDSWNAWGTPQWATDAMGTFGFGHPNYLFNMIHPVMLAAALHACCRPGEWRRSERIWLVCGWAALAFGIYITKRRGVPVALIAGLGLCWWVSLWHSRRRLAYAILALAGTAAMGLGLYLYSHEMPAYRMGRLRLYQAALETAAHGFPWGWGSYGANQIIHSTSEASRHLTATGGWAFHAHNEILDVLLEGGPVAVALWVMAGWLIWSRVRRIIDPVLRQSAIVMVGAIGTHMMTDPVFGQDCGQLYLAVMIAWIFVAPARPSGRGWRPPVLWNIRLMAWPLVLLSCWGVATGIYPAVLHRDAEAAVREKCHKAAMHPQWASLSFKDLVVNPALSAVKKREIAAVQLSKTGWTMSNIPPQISYSDTADPAGQVVDLLRFIDKLPFERIGYRGLDILLTQNPALKEMVPPRILANLPYLRGDIGLAEPDLQMAPTTMDEAIDCFARIIWALERGLPIERIAPALQALCRRYADIPGVSLIAVEAGLEKPEVFDFLIPYKDNMKECYLTRTSEILGELKTPAQARIALPLVRTLWAPLVDDFDAGRMTKNYQSGAYVEIYYAVLRVWMLTRIKDEVVKATMSTSSQPTTSMPPASGETGSTLQAPIPAGTPEANSR